jgi:bifunctional non-homologous end joining protein LigD
MGEPKQEIEVEGRTLTVKRTTKPLFPAQGRHKEISKGQVIDYYERIAKTMLPHLEGRPVSLQRCPDGIDSCFFQKDVPDYFPDWIARAELPAEGKSVDYLLVEEPATLAYLANQGAIALHVGLSRVDAPQHPDRLIFDLDPPGGAFGEVRWAAGVLREAFTAMDMPSYAMTTGSKGLHVVVPLDRSADFDAAKTFARRLAEYLAERHLERLTVEQRKDKRQGRVFLDFLRNAYAQTAVAPYSLRTLPGAPVAMPIDWNEITGKLQPDRWTIANTFRRLSRKRDPWARIDRHAVKLDEKKLDKLIGR